MEYLQKAITWSGSTKEMEMEMIQNLKLDGDYRWAGCEITIEGQKGKNTHVNLSLHVDGELHDLTMPINVTLHGEESVTYSYIVNKKCPIVVTGYIKSNSRKGAGVIITLTGFYYDGEKV